MIPAIVRMSEDLPAPFVPITPSTWPYATSKFTFSSACTTRVCFVPRPSAFARALRVGLRTIAVVYVRLRFLTETAISPVLCWVLEADSELTLPR